MTGCGQNVVPAAGRRQTRTGFFAVLWTALSPLIGGGWRFDDEPYAQSWPWSVSMASSVVAAV